MPQRDCRLLNCFLALVVISIAVLAHSESDGVVQHARIGPMPLRMRVTILHETGELSGLYTKLSRSESSAGQRDDHIRAAMEATLGQEKTLRCEGQSLILTCRAEYEIEEINPGDDSSEKWFKIVEYLQGRAQTAVDVNGRVQVDADVLNSLITKAAFPSEDFTLIIADYPIVRKDTGEARTDYCYSLGTEFTDPSITFLSRTSWAALVDLRAKGCRADYLEQHPQAVAPNYALGLEHRPAIIAAWALTALKGLLIPELRTCEFPQEHTTQERVLLNVYEFRDHGDDPILPEAIHKAATLLERIVPDEVDSSVQRINVPRASWETSPELLTGLVASLESETVLTSSKAFDELMRVLVREDETEASTQTTRFHVFILSLKNSLSSRILLDGGRAVAAFPRGAIILDGAAALGSGFSSSTRARKSELLIRAVLMLGGSIAPDFEERSGFRRLQANPTKRTDTDLFHTINSVLASRRAWVVKELEVAARISENLNILREDFIGLSSDQKRIDDLIRELNDQNKALLSESTPNGLYSQSLKLKEVAGNALTVASDISKAADTRTRCDSNASPLRYSLAIERTARMPLWTNRYVTGLVLFVLTACAVAAYTSIQRLMVSLVAATSVWSSASQGVVICRVLNASTWVTLFGVKATQRSRRDHPVDVHVYRKLPEARSLRRPSGTIISKRASVNIPRRQRAAATEEQRKSSDVFRKLSA
ncbi:hypothetical protein NDN08_001802 [Rhodosorus marinus]|uniref:Transmembrane protein n=1 Tax=Rhodosorus marinus TaxID=101924 RepID=A0AAV8URV9_9RHOD|nr:hypothetical protein NDN08_001802 [Rhodosorus marinus]